MVSNWRVRFVAAVSLLSMAVMIALRSNLGLVEEIEVFFVRQFNAPVVLRTSEEIPFEPDVEYMQEEENIRLVNWNSSGAMDLTDIQHLGKWAPVGDDLRLPRASQRRYNDLDQFLGGKFLVYTPSGGFNNQLIALLQAVYFAKRTGRVLIVPPAGSHKNFNSGYWNNEDITPMDTVVDLDHLEKYSEVGLLPVNKMLKSYFDDLEIEMKTRPGKRRDGRVVKVIIPVQTKDVEVIDLMPTMNSPGKGFLHMKITSSYKILLESIKSEARFLVFFGRFFSKHYDQFLPWDGLSYTPFFRAFAKTIAQNTFQGHDFHAMHIRVRDKLYLYKKAHTSKQFKTLDATIFLKAAEEINMDLELPIYVATDNPSPRKSKFFRKFLSSMKDVHFGEDLDKNTVTKSWMKRFDSAFESNELHDAIFSALEQLICVHATKFVGSKHSTLSRVIHRMRENLWSSLPDLADELLSNQLLHKKERQSISIDLQRSLGYKSINETSLVLLRRKKSNWLQELNCSIHNC